MKRTFQALSLAAVLYFLFMLLDFKGSPRKGADGASPAANTAMSHESSSSDFQPSKPSFKNTRRVALKPLPRISRTAIVSQEETSATPEAIPLEKLNPPHQLEPTPKEGVWEKHEIPSAANTCPQWRDCTPRGRDGVLLLGSQWAVNTPRASWQGQVHKGNAVDQSPLYYSK